MQPSAQTSDGTRRPLPACVRPDVTNHQAREDAQGFVWTDYAETHHAVDHARIARAWADIEADELAAGLLFVGTVGEFLDGLDV